MIKTKRHEVFVLEIKQAISEQNLFNLGESDKNFSEGFEKSHETNSCLSGRKCFQDTILALILNSLIRWSFENELEYFECIM
jgi:hypothetical protein